MLPKYKRNNLLRINTKPTYFRNRKPHPKLTTPVPCLYRWSKSEKDYVFVKNTRRSLFKSDYDFYILWSKDQILPIKPNQYENRLSPDKEKLTKSYQLSEEKKIKLMNLKEKIRLRNLKKRKEKCLIC